MLFNNCLRYGVFPNDWKKANVIPVHKKGNEQLVSNYYPLSLLLICSKIFEKLIFDCIYDFLDQNCLLKANQVWWFLYTPAYSYYNNIFTAFDANPSLEVHGIFPDLTKAFDRVWHKGLIHKLKNTGIDGNLLSLIESFLHNRYQRVVLNGQSSKWQNVNAGLPQGSVLGPLFFLIYINDLPQGLHSDVKLFADDTSLFSVIHDVDASSATLNNDLVKIQEWAYNWKMSFNPDRNKQAQEVIFSRKLRKVFHPNLSFNDQPIERSVAHKHLGLTLDEKLSFTNCINDKINKTLKGVDLLRKLSTLLPWQNLLTIYKSFKIPLGLRWCHLRSTS